MLPEWNEPSTMYNVSRRIFQNPHHVKFILFRISESQFRFKTFLWLLLPSRIPEKTKRSVLDAVPFLIDGMAFIFSSPLLRLDNFSRLTNV